MRPDFCHGEAALGARVCRESHWPGLAVALCTALMAVATPAVAQGQADGPALLRAARAQIEEFAYDSAYKLLVRVLNTPDEAPATLVHANTLYAINELNRVTTGKTAARGAFLEALRLDPLLMIDSLSHLHSDAKAVFLDALALAPPATKNLRTAAAAPAPPSPATPATPATPALQRAANKAPGGVPTHMLARVVSVHERDHTAVLAVGLEEKSPNVLDPPCIAFIALFWDVLGFEVDPSRLCAMSAVVAFKGKPAQTLINFTRLVRLKDGAIEADTRPAPIAEWFNETTGKRIQFNIRGDTVLVTDLTPIIELSPMPPRKADTVVTVRLAGEAGTYYITRFETRGASLAGAPDSQPLELPVSHAHRARESCDGVLSFDGDQFRYTSAQTGGHGFRFTIDDVLSGSLEQGAGRLRARAGGEEQFIVRENWHRLVSALVAARRR